MNFGIQTAARQPRISLPGTKPRMAKHSSPQTSKPRSCSQICGGRAKEQHRGPPA